MTQTKNLEKIQELQKSTNRGGYFRCSCCNTVSNEAIETNIGDYKPKMSFVNDPIDPLHFICIDCMDVVEEQRYEYTFLDDEQETISVWANRT